MACSHFAATVLSVIEEIHPLFIAVCNEVVDCGLERVEGQIGFLVEDSIHNLAVRRNTFIHIHLEPTKHNGDQPRYVSEV
jgi:hypothetical protein